MFLNNPDEKQASLKSTLLFLVLGFLLSFAGANPEHISAQSDSLQSSEHAVIASGRSEGLITRYLQPQSHSGDRPEPLLFTGAELKLAGVYRMLHSVASGFSELAARPAQPVFSRPPARASP
ncbi:hypothetical protein J3369_15415 [Alteromonas sp. NFXS44]|uniref:hypothetical protein n=1 Tax=Alteromonas sp. NFXS44 TaxID=2818435 RepID=UPI0032DEE2C2